MNQKINFASDNYSGVSPEVLEYLKKVNFGPAPAYGGDTYTDLAQSLFKDEFGPHSESFFVWNGTSANVLGLQALLGRHEAVICADSAHIHMDECGAPERHTGAKLIVVQQQHGKINSESIKKHLHRKGDVHAVQPRVVSITQATECGTVYTLEELRSLSQFAHENDLYLHMDGARLVNAAVSLNCSFRAMTDCGIDLLSFGGTKNGLMGAEAVVILNSKVPSSFPFIRKQGMHLASKMRFVSAQFLAYFEDRLWEKNALHANRMAQLLKKELLSMGDRVKITHPVEANELFCILPREWIEKLQQKFYFYVWNELIDEVRFVTTFQTTPEEIFSFGEEIRKF